MTKNSLVVAELFDDWADDYDAYTTKDMAYKSPIRVFKAIRSYLKDGQSVLDVGIGTGLLSGQIKNHADIHVTGVDYSSRMLSVCKKEKRADRLEKVDLNSEKLPFKGNSFDLVVSCGVTEFIHPVKKLFKDMTRIVKPEGIIAVTYELSDEKDVSRVKQDNYTSYAYSASYIARLMADIGVKKIKQTDFKSYKLDNQSLKHGLFIGQPL